MEDQDKAEPKEIVKDGPVEAKPVRDKKKVNKPAIFFGIVALMLAGVSVFFGIEYFKPKNNETNHETDVTNNTGNNNDNKPTNVGSMADQYKEVYDVVSSITSGIKTERDYIETGVGLPYKPEGLNTYIPMRFDLYKKIMNSNSNEKNVEMIESKLVDAGFQSAGILPFLGSAGPRIAGYLNSDNIVCGVFGDNDYGKDVVILECAKTDWHWLTEDEKKLVGELETAYRDKTGEYPTVLYNFDNKIKDSQYAPYQTLNVQIGGGYALFYRTSSEEKWQYFAGGQSDLDCSDYNTEDLKKAFAGDACYNGNQQSTVQL